MEAFSEPTINIPNTPVAIRLIPKSAGVGVRAVTNAQSVNSWVDRKIRSTVIGLFTRDIRIPPKPNPNAIEEKT